MDRAGYFDRWTRLHGGYDPRSNTLVRLWLGWVYVVARPLAAARVPPDAVTAGAVLISAGAVGLAALGGRWALAASAVVVLAGLMDNLDGAVAVLSDRVSRHGAVLDAACDRVSDLLLVAALWLLGAPMLPCVLGGSFMLLQEYIRAVASVAGMDDVGVITVWERPTRVIVTAMFALATGVWLDPIWAALGAAAWVALGIVGTGQLAVVVRRQLG